MTDTDVVTITIEGQVHRVAASVFRRILTSAAPKLRATEVGGGADVPSGRSRRSGHNPRAPVQAQVPHMTRPEAKLEAMEESQMRGEIYVFYSVDGDWATMKLQDFRRVSHSGMSQLRYVLPSGEILEHS